MRKVSVENGLDIVRQKLEERGYEVVDMENCMSPVEAVVYFGDGIVNNPCNHRPDGTMLVNAQGLTPDAVVERLDNI